MNKVFQIAQIISAITLISLILIQSRGTGFGRPSSNSSSSFTRRGIEKIVFKLTFIIAAIFIVAALLPFFI